MRLPLLSLLLLLACAPAGAATRLTLKAGVAVPGARVTLADVADGGERAALAAIDLGAAPLPGYTARFTRAELARLLRARALPYELAGAEAVAVDRSSQSFDQQGVLAAAEAELRRLWDGQAERLALRLAAPLPELQLPQGQVKLQARALAAGARRSRVTVWVDVLLDGAFVRTVPVPYEVQAWRQVLVATRALAAGATPGCESLVPRERDIAALDGAPAANDCHAVAGRLRRALPQDAVLQAQQLQAERAVAQGESVALRLFDGAIALESRATALDDGDVGQRIDVKPANGNSAVRAEVIGPGLVRITGK
jgi:flagella basal body P-ring formation protein FlgA